MKTNLAKFESYSLTKEELKSVVGGKQAFCTNGDHAACYLNPQDAVNACFGDPSCTSVTVQQY